MYIERMVEKKILEWLEEHEIILILGSRRVGKTTLLKHILSSQVHKPYYYIDFEDINLRNIANSGVENFVNFLQLNGIDLSEKSIIGLDEIQKVNDPSNLLKMLHDHYPKLKLIVTGSSSIDINKKFTDSLAGRKVTFILNAFNFREFLLAKDKNLFSLLKRVPSFLDLITNDFDLDPFKGILYKFTPLINEYLVFGGYPDIIFAQTPEKKGKRLYDIITSHIEKDIKDLSNINNIEGFNKILIAVSSNVNNIINKSNLARIAQVNIHTVEHYLTLLKKIYILNELRPYYKNKETEIVKQTKIYFSDNGIRNKIINNMSLMENRADTGELTEMFVFNHLNQIENTLINFWRTKSGAEVDFILSYNSQIFPIEVKSSIIRIGQVSKSLVSFIKKYKPQKAIIINKSNMGKFTLEGCTVYYLPFAII